MSSRHLFATFEQVKSLYKTKIMNIHRRKFSDGCNFLETQSVTASSKRISGRVCEEANISQRMHSILLNAVEIIQLALFRGYKLPRTLTKC